MIYKHTKGFSILIALGFMILMSSIGLYLLEYMIPFSRNIKGVENASQAYYQAYGWVEDALLYAYSGWLWAEPSDPLVWSIDFEYTTSASGTLIPEAGKWDSEYDDEWNQISQEKPIQLSIWNGRLTSWGNRIIVRFQVPNFDGIWWADSLDTTPNDDLILWQLSSNTESISTRNVAIIAESDITWADLELWSTGWYGRWVFPNGATGNFSSFYTANCAGAWSGCILKIAIINPLESSVSWQLFPYLEYQLTTSDPIPFQYSNISSTGQSVSFKKNLEISVLQQNTNAAFDFAIFQ